ncbi:hypothetical protein EDC04DRAFT_2604211 [Pisolithus marmoratus]|nr:hypothetical protein EDC04DRAFT_2604211 [Pisolithus marmoratus]
MHQSKKKRKKVTDSTNDLLPDKLGASSIQPTVNSKPALVKRNKNKKKDDVDDVDKALAELSINLAAHLDAESELCKFFGSRAVMVADLSKTGPSQPQMMAWDAI